jgi:cold shock CspA family protein
VDRVVVGEGYGFLRTDDGREVYFHRNCLKGVDFDSLEPGTEVRFAEEPGRDGPQATVVRPLRRRSRAHA